MVQQVALVSQAPSVTHKEVSRVSAAIQKQVTRDFGPIWSVTATVDSFAALDDVPLGYWPVIVRDDVGDHYQAAGLHLDDNGQPFSLVQASDDGAETASHETLEMVADAFGDRVIAGPAPKEAKKQGRVEFLVEVCNPSEATAYGYTVNDVLVSDFYTPSFFDPVVASGVRYSFTGAITKPRQILKGGYISWHNTVDNHWYQLRWFNTAKPTLADLGVFEASAKSTREWIDEQTETPLRKKEAAVRVKSRSMFASPVPGSGTGKAAGGRAARLEEQIARLIET